MSNWSENEVQNELKRQRELELVKAREAYFLRLEEKKAKKRAISQESRPAQTIVEIKKLDRELKLGNKLSDINKLMWNGSGIIKHEWDDMSAVHQLSFRYSYMVDAIDPENGGTYTVGMQAILKVGVFRLTQVGFTLFVNAEKSFNALGEKPNRYSEYPHSFGDQIGDFERGLLSASEWVLTDNRENSLFLSLD